MSEINIYRYKITIGNHERFLSNPFELNRNDIIRMIKNSWESNQEKMFLEIDLKDPELSKDCRRFPRKSFITETKDTGGYRSFDISRVKIENYGYYEGYENNELVYNYFKDLDENTIIDDLNTLLQEFDIDRKLFQKQVLDLVQSKNLQLMYRVESEEWQDSLSNIPRGYPLDQIRVAFKRI